MEKLIITWTESDYENEWNHAIPVIYESVQKFHDDLYAAISNMIVETEKQDEIQKKYNEGIRKIFDKIAKAKNEKKKALEEELGEFDRKVPHAKLIEFKVKLGKVLLPINSFIDNKTKNNSYKINMPTILTLDQWFDSFIEK